MQVDAVLPRDTSIQAYLIRNDRSTGHIGGSYIDQLSELPCLVDPSPGRKLLGDGNAPEDIG